MCKKSYQESLNNKGYTNYFITRRNVGYMQTHVFDELDLNNLDNVDERVLLLPNKPHLNRYIVFASVTEINRLFLELESLNVLDTQLSSYIKRILNALSYLTQTDKVGKEFTDENKHILHFLLSNKINNAILNNVLKDDLKEYFDEGTLEYDETHFKAVNNYKDSKHYCAIMYKKYSCPVQSFVSRVSALTQTLNLSVGCDSDFMTDDNLHEKTAYHINILSNVFQYILNSYSFKNNSMQFFDELDINLKLPTLI